VEGALLRTRTGEPTLSAIVDAFIASKTTAAQSSLAAAERD
jgi:hypothetical protein